MRGLRAVAARPFAGGWPVLPDALRGNPLGLLGRWRAMLRQRAAPRGQASPSKAWIDLNDS